MAALPAPLLMLIHEYAEYHPLLEYCRGIQYGRYTISFGNEFFRKKADVTICEDSVTFDVYEADYVNTTPLYKEQLLVWYRNSFPALLKIDQILSEIFPDYRVIQECIDFDGFVPRHNGRWGCSAIFKVLILQLKPGPSHEIGGRRA